MGVKRARRRGNLAAPPEYDYEITNLGDERIRIKLALGKEPGVTIITTPEDAAALADAIWRCYDEAVGIAPVKDASLPSWG